MSAGMTAKEVANNMSYHAKYTAGVMDPATMTTTATYRAAAASLQERLIDNWDATFSHFERENPKMAYYLSMEYLQGRTLNNAVRNVALDTQYGKVLAALGSSLETVEDAERDAALGNGGLGRLAACFLDSIASCDLPGWGYGLRYKYGLFKQHTSDSGQIEAADDWLDVGNPWEVKRPEVAYPIGFGGKVDGGVWYPDETVMAVAYDTPIPGYKTTNCISLRLWDAQPMSSDFDLAKFNEGDHLDAIRKQARIAEINAVLYPADETAEGKLLRLRQQYMLCAASVQDIMETFRRRSLAHTGTIDWFQFPDKVAIQMNDTHPTLAAPELMRLLMDCEGLSWDDAWSIVTRTVNYTNHTVLPEALEKWSLKLLEQLLPRHMEIVKKINADFLASVPALMEGSTPAAIRKVKEATTILGNVDVETGKTLYEGTGQWHRLPDHEQDSEIMRELDPVVAMANLCVISGQAVNGVAALHSEIVKDEVFNDFYKIMPHKFQNKTNGVTPRRWLAWCNPELSTVITKALGTDKWIQDLGLLEGLLPLADDKKLQKDWMKAKLKNKTKTAAWLKEVTGYDVPASAMFDCQVKRIHEYKRQLLNALAIAHRYSEIKKTPAKDRKKKFVPKVCMIGGKAFATYTQAKRIVRLICQMSKVINNDPDCEDLLKVVFVPNYNVTVAERLIPATELCHQISTAGMEASGTSNMKFMMNGSLTVGTLDGANVEIRECAGAENFFLFGATADMIPQIRSDRAAGKFTPDPRFEAVVAFIRSGVFGDDEKSLKIFDEMLGTLEGNSGFGRADYFCVGYDFPSYLDALAEADAMYRDQTAWARASIINTATSGKFSSDRTIRQYASEIWGITPCRVPDDA